MYLTAQTSRYQTAEPGKVSRAMVQHAAGWVPASPVSAPVDAVWWWCRNPVGSWAQASGPEMRPSTGSNHHFAVDN